MEKTYFNHEKLAAYQAALDFAAWAAEVIERLPAKLSVRDQLDRAATSAVLNIAEGNAKFSLRDRRRYFEIAIGSALECSACLDILTMRKQLTPEQVHTGKSKIQRVAATVMGLIRSTEKQISEEPVDYSVTPLEPSSL